jgi:4-amino-4-deoxy-L-arabinose transferase-like glycosyltransferase
MLKNSTHRQRVILFCVFLFGLIFRLILVGYVTPYPERYIQADAVGYNHLAINLASGHGFSMEATPPYIPDNFRTPGYPLTIASIYTLLGYRPDIILLLQAFMGAFTILLVYYLAALILNPSAGLIAAALLAVSPHSITYSALLWSDTEYTLLFTLSFILTSLMLINNNYKWILLSSSVSGVAVLVHPRSIYLPVFFALLLMGVMLQKRIPLRKTLVLVGIYILVFTLILIPWRLRNYNVFEVPNISSAAGINMLAYGAALTESARTGEDQWSIANRYDAEIREMSSSTLNQAEFSELAFRLGLNKILQDPMTYAKIQIIGMAKVFLPGTSQINTLLTGRPSLDTTQIFSLFTTDQILQYGAITQSLTEFSTFVWGYIGFEILYLCCIYIFSFYALIRQNRSLLWLWLILIVLLYLAAVAGPAGSPRFRVVMMPLLSVTAACGIMSIRYISRTMDKLCKSQS